MVENRSSIGVLNRLARVVRCSQSMGLSPRSQTLLIQDTYLIRPSGRGSDSTGRRDYADSPFLRDITGGFIKVAAKHSAQILFMLYFLIQIIDSIEAAIKISKTRPQVV
jgi:hypothetical protein